MTRKKESVSMPVAHHAESIIATIDPLRGWADLARKSILKLQLCVNNLALFEQEITIQSDDRYMETIASISGNEPKPCLQLIWQTVRPLHPFLHRAEMGILFKLRDVGFDVRVARCDQPFQFQMADCKILSLRLPLPANQDSPSMIDTDIEITSTEFIHDFSRRFESTWSASQSFDSIAIATIHSLSERDQCSERELAIALNVPERFIIEIMSASYQQSNCVLT